MKETIRGLAERVGQDPDRLEATFEKWRSGGGKVGFDAGPDHV